MSVNRFSDELRDDSLLSDIVRNGILNITNDLTEFCQTDTGKVAIKIYFFKFTLKY